MPYSGKQLLNALQQVPWIVAERAYGNSHATLIGLLVQWWITADPTTRWVVEGGPSFDTRRQGVGGGICDALFCTGDDVVGVLEVEGTRGPATATKMGSFFAAAYPTLQTLQFGILLLYAYEPKGAGTERKFQPAGDAATLAEVGQVSQKYPEKPLIVITLDKTYVRQSTGIRARSEYYAGQLSTVRGLLYEQGQQTTMCLLYRSEQAADSEPQQQHPDIESRINRLRGYCEP